METEIIKVNSITNSMHSLFKNIAAKFKSNTNYDITVIMQPNNEPPLATSDPGKVEKDKQKHAVNFKNKIIFNEDLQGSSISLSSQNNSQQSHLIQKSFTETQMKKIIKEVSSRHRRSKHKKENYVSKQQQTGSSKLVQGDVAPEDNILKTQIRINDQEIDNSNNYEVKINNEIEQSAKSPSQSSEEDNDSNAGFLIEQHLNQALVLVEHKKYRDLEDFLYNYKEKYNFINIRTQTKWSLLIAHCKQMKLEFERAAANYAQVIRNFKENPRMMPIELGDIYNRLGLCYYQIREFNKGITAFSQALNCYKQSKKVIEYSNCIINLGVLYQEAQYFIEAERCFLMAYNIRRYEGQVKNRSNLLSILFNLVQCNMSLQNYIQTKKLLELIQEIIEESQNVGIDYKINMYTKKAKLQFFEGQLSTAYKLCQKALNLVQEAGYLKLEYAEVYELMGLLKAVQMQFHRSKDYFITALKLVQKYEPNDSIKIQNIKKRLTMISRQSKRSNKNMESGRRKVTERNQQFVSSQESSVQIEQSLKS